MRSGDVNDDVMFIVIYRVTVLERGSPHSVGLQECGKVIFSYHYCQFTQLSVWYVIVDAKCQSSHC